MSSIAVLLDQNDIHFNKQKFQNLSTFFLCGATLFLLQYWIYYQEHHRSTTGVCNNPSVLSFKKLNCASLKGKLLIGLIV